MNISRITIPFSIALLGPTLSGCSDKVEEQASAMADTIEDSWDSVKQYSIERSAEFRLYLNGQMRQLDDQMNSMSARTGEAWSATKAELARKRAALAVELDGLGAATAATWHTARDKTAALYEDLRDSVDRALNQPEA